MKLNKLTIILGAAVMANAALVQLKVDSEIKEDVSRIYENLGLDLPTAIRIFFKKSIAVGGLPFELREENNRWQLYDATHIEMN